LGFEDHETHHQISMLLAEVLIMQYRNTLAASTLIILFVQTLEILNNFILFLFFSQRTKFCEGH
jgi:hypothetical protein